jgi:hypothetical protein
MWQVPSTPTNLFAATDADSAAAREDAARGPLVDYSPRRWPQSPGSRRPIHLERTAIERVPSRGTAAMTVSWREPGVVGSDCDDHFTATECA